MKLHCLLGVILAPCLLFAESEEPGFCSNVVWSSPPVTIDSRVENGFTEIDGTRDVAYDSAWMPEAARLRVSVRMTGADSWTILFDDAAPCAGVVSWSAVDATGGWYEFRAEGLDGTGGVVATWSTQVSVPGIDACSEVVWSSPAVMIDARVENGFTEINGTRYVAYDSAWMPEAARLRVSVRMAGSNSWTILFENAAPCAGVLSWSAADATGGWYEFRAEGLDGTGGVVATWSTQVSVPGIDACSEVVWSSPAVAVDARVENGFSEVDGLYSVPYDSAWIPGATRLRMSVEPGETMLLDAGAPCAGMVSWDAGVLPDGRYVFTLEALDATGVVIQTYVTGVDVLRMLFSESMVSGIHVNAKAGTGLLAMRDVERLTYNVAWQDTLPTDGLKTKLSASSRVEDWTKLFETNDTVFGEWTWETWALTPGLYTVRHQIFNNETALSTMTAQFWKPAANVMLHSGCLTGNEVWTAEYVHVVTTMIIVPSGVTLEIRPNTVVKFLDGTGIEVKSGGRLIVSNAILTHIADDTAGGDTLDDRDAMQPVFGAWVITGAGSVEIDLATEERYLPPTVTSGTLSSDQVWRGGGRVYVVENDLTIPNGRTLTIQPGAILKMNFNVSITVNSGGTLNAIGTRAQPIVFTSCRDDAHGGKTWTNFGMYEGNPQPGDWAKIAMNSGVASMEYVSILYSSRAQTTGAINMNGGRVSFVNSEIAHGLYDAVGVESGNFYMTNSVIRDCLLAFRHWPREPIVNCVIYDCGRITQGGGQNFVNCVFMNIIETWEAFGWSSQYKNCLFYNPPGLAMQSAQPVGSNGNIWGNPFFANPDRGDFRLLPRSPCIDAGDGRVAPLLDYYGQPRMDVPGAAQKGMPGTNGQYPDIGIHEYMPESAASEIDLAAFSVVADADAMVGSLLTVEWTVQNIGTQPANTPWRDVVALVSEHGQTVVLGERLNSWFLPAGESFVCSAQFNVPAMMEGDWFAKVTVNAHRDVFEGMAIQNNVMESVDPTRVTLPQRIFGNEFSVPLGSGESIAFRLTGLPAGGGGLQFYSLGSDGYQYASSYVPDGSLSLEGYAANGYAPNATANDWKATRLPNRYNLMALPPEAGTDDLYVTLVNTSAKSGTVKVTFINESPVIAETTRIHLFPGGKTTISVYGVGLSDATSVELRGVFPPKPDGIFPGFPRLISFTATSITHVSDNEISLVFAPNTNLELGMCMLDLWVTTPKGTAFKAEVFDFTNSLGVKPFLNAWLEVPDAVRANRVYTGYVCFQNTGHVEMPAPYFNVRVTNGKLSADMEGGIPDTDAIAVMGVSSTTPAGVLKPTYTVLTPMQMTQRIPFRFVALGSPKFELFSWDGGELADVVTEMEKHGRVEYRPGKLEWFEELRATGAVVSGTLLNKATNDALKGAEVAAISEDGDILSYDTVDANGCFILPGVPRGANVTLQVLSGAFADDLEVEVPMSGDVFKVRWFGERGRGVSVMLKGFTEEELAVGVDVSMSGGGLRAPMMKRVDSAEECVFFVGGAGTYTAEARFAETARLRKDVTVRAGDTGATVVLSREDVSVIQGRVYDTTGNALPDAVIMIRNLYAPFSGQAFCNSSGEYAYYGAATGSYSAQAYLNRYEASATEVLVLSAKEQVEVDFVLQAAHQTLTANVGSDNAEGMVFVMRTDGQGSGFATVDWNGEAVVEGLTPGVYYMAVFNADGLLVAEQFDVAVPSGGTVFMVSQTRSRVTGRLLVGAGQSVNDGIVLFKELSGGETKWVETDNAGQFQASLRNGTYLVGAAAEGFLTKQLVLTVETGLNTEIPLNAGGTIEGQLPKGFKADDAQVYAVDEDGGIHDLYVEKNGSFANNALAAGVYKVFALFSDCALDYGTVTVSVGATTTAEVTTDGRRIEVTLQGSGSREAAWLLVEHNDGSGLENWVSVEGVTIVLREYPLIPLRVYAMTESFGIITYADLDATGQAVTLNVPATQTVSGTLAGLTGATIVFHCADGIRGGFCEVLPDGRFFASGIPADWRDAWITANDGTAFGLTRMEIESANRQIQAPFAQLVEQRFEVLLDHAGRSPVAGVTLTLVNADSNTVTVATDHTGAATFRVKPGTYTLGAELARVYEYADDAFTIAAFPSTMTLYLEDGMLDDAANVLITPQPFMMAAMSATSSTLFTPQGMGNFFRLWTTKNRCYEDLAELRNAAEKYMYKDHPPFEVCPKCGCNCNLIKYNNWKKWKVAYLASHDRAHNELQHIDAFEWSVRTQGLNALTALLKFIPAFNKGYSVAEPYGEALANIITGDWKSAAGNIADALYESKNNETLIGSLKKQLETATKRRDTMINNALKNGKPQPNGVGGYNTTIKNLQAKIAALQAIGPAIGLYQELNKLREDILSLIALQDAYWGKTKPELLMAFNELRKAHAAQYNHKCHEPPPPGPKPHPPNPNPPNPNSEDPNMMTGPLGFGNPDTERFVQPGQWMNYIIYFENLPEATGAAQEVWVEHQMSKWLDWSTFEMGEVAFHNQIDLGLSGKSFGESTVQLNGTNYQVRTSLAVNQETGKASWYLRIVDPTTPDGWPLDPYAGFLPPNDPETFVGEGHVSFRVRLREDAPEGLHLAAKADIQFDYNEWMSTDDFDGSWWNTVKHKPLVQAAAFATSTIRVNEGAAAVLEVTGGNPDFASEVSWWIVPGTATANKDYAAPKVMPQKLVWQAGEIATKTISIPTLTDKLVEDEEFFTVVLGDPVNMELGEVFTCRVTIVDANAQATLASALENAAYKFASSGAGAWLPRKVMRDGAEVDAAVGYATGNGKVASLKTSVSAASAGTLYFSVRITGAADESPKTLLRLMDGKANLASWPNATEWTDVAVPLAKGSHALAWEVVQGGDPEARAHVANVRFIPDGAVACRLDVVSSDPQGGDVFGAGVYAAGTKVALSAKARPGWVFAGWRGGNFARPATAAQSVTLTGDVSLTAEFARVPYVHGLALQPQGGKVMGSGYAATGRSVTLTATPAKGWLFVAWQDGSAATKRVVTAAQAAEDSVNGIAEYRAIFRCILPTILTSGTFTGMAGVALEIPVEIDSELPAKLSAARLPAGLKVVGDSIIGAATAKADAVVTLTATSAAGKSTREIRLVIEPLAPRAQGTFTGYLTRDDIISGSFNVAVTSAGKVTAKVISSSGTFSFSGASWTSVDNGIFTMNLRTAKGETLDLALDANAAWNSLHLGGRFNDAHELLGQRRAFADKADVIAKTALASHAGYYTVAAPLDGTLDFGAAQNVPEGHGYLTATIAGTDGGVKLAGKLADGAAVSGSGVLLIDGDTAIIPCFFPLYSGKGHVSGLLFSDAEKSLNGEFWQWSYPGKTPAGKPPAVEDRFTLTLAPRGGFYAPVASLANHYLTATNLPPDYLYVKGAYNAQSPAINLPHVAFTSDAKGNFVLPGAKPGAVDKAGNYVYAADNPAVATFTLAKTTGLFSGRFNLYYEYLDERNVPKLKATSVTHQGVLTPALDVLGWGYYLVPATWQSDDAKPLIYKLNRSLKVNIGE